ncbi:hypothetical protein QTP70_026923, partial [Hemibagrus guttatus]
LTTQPERHVLMTSPRIKPDHNRPGSRLIPDAERPDPGNGPVIFAIRCVPLITLLLAVCFLNRDYKQSKRIKSGGVLAQCSVCDGLSEMQRLCTTLCGLLASCLCSWGSGSFSVSQSPSTVILDEVDQVQIICSWNISIVHGAKVKWFKNNQKLELNQSDRFTETCKNNTCTTLVIKNADRNDEGLYICCVTQDIPFLLTVNGTGTNVTYKGNTDDGKVTSTTQTNSATTSQSQFGSLEAVVGAMASAAGVILSICVCVWWIKTRNRQSERVVIREGPPSEGDEPEHSEDGGSSRTSRGSTQWYMVPVYESYFDLQRSDDQQCAGSDTDAACAEAQK